MQADAARPRGACTPVGICQGDAPRLQQPVASCLASTEASRGSVQGKACMRGGGCTGEGRHVGRGLCRRGPACRAGGYKGEGVHALR